MAAHTVIVDLGSQTTKILSGSNKLLTEATCIAYHAESHICVALGSKAALLVGREPEGVVVSYPVQNGVVADVDAVILFLHEVLKKVLKVSWKHTLRPKTAVLLVSKTLTPAQKHVLSMALNSIQTVNFTVKSREVALARYYQQLGYQPPALWIVEVGAAHTLTAVVYEQKILAVKKIRWGSRRLDSVLQAHVLARYGCEISLTQAAELKQQLDVQQEKKGKHGDISLVTKHATSRMLTTVELKRKQLIEVLEQEYVELVEELDSFLSSLPVDSMKEALAEGVSLSGGGSLSVGLDSFLSQHLHTSVRVAKDPVLAAALGAHTYYGT